MPVKIGITSTVFVATILDVFELLRPSPSASDTTRRRCAISSAQRGPRGLLSSTQQGRAGGVLTERALELLDEGD